MRYASVCSGVEAASLAWMPLGWEPVWFSEIESFPCEVLEAIEFLQKTGETVIEVKIDHEYARCFGNDFSARIVTARKGKNE